MANMSPKEFMSLYRNMLVPLIDGNAIVDVQEYRNNLDSYRADAALVARSARTTVQQRSHAEHSTYYGHQEARPQMRRGLASFARAHGVTIQSNQYDFSRLSPPLSVGGRSFPSLASLLGGDGVVDMHQVDRCFSGKGSPAATRRVLQLAHLLGLLGPAGGTLQGYCDRYLGLDCNGFLQNYLSELRGMPGEFQDKGSKEYDYWAPQTRRRRSLADIRPRDILCWAPNARNIGHVNIIDDAGFHAVHLKGYLQCNVVESCGTAHDITRRDGLMCSQYILRQHGDYRFEADRGLTEAWDHSVVYISAPPMT
jgi:hypothetical protein